MRFYLEIEMGNDACQTADDVAELLTGLAYRLRSGPSDETEGNVRDANGNTVGAWRLMEDKDHG